MEGTQKGLDVKGWPVQLSSRSTNVSCTKRS